MQVIEKVILHSATCASAQLHHILCWCLMCICGSILSTLMVISKLVQIIMQVQRHCCPVDTEAGTLATEVHIMILSHQLLH